MNAYLQLCRPVNVVMAGVGFIVACFMAAGTGITDYVMTLIPATVLVMMFVSGGNALNDYVDAEIDKTSHPERPVPTGRISPIAARNFGIALLVSAFLLSILSLDWKIIVIAGTAMVLMFGYEMGLKQRGFVGNLTIATMTGMVFLMGGAAVSHLMEGVFPCMMAILANVGREVSKDIEDMDGDAGRHTLPMAIGRKRASIVAASFFIAGSVLSIVPMFMGLYGPLYYTVFIAIIAFVMAAVFVMRDPRKGQITSKIGMILGLVAFILGVFRF